MAPEPNEEFTLARTLDIHYLTNKILLILLAIVFLGSFGWFYFTNRTIMQSIVFAFLQIILVFLCWAIAREIDPDHDYAAFFGIPLLFLPFTIVQGNILILLWLIMSLRLINQTTGKATSSSDVTVFIFLSIITSLVSIQLLILPLSISIILLTSFLPKKQPALSFLSIPLLPSFILLILIFPESWDFLNPSPWLLIYIAFSSALLLLVTTMTDEVNCKGDYSYKRLSLKRVQTAQIIAVLSVLLLTTFHGNILSIFPAWAAITGVGVFRLVHLIINK
jgi:hypothetical protein